MLRRSLRLILVVAMATPVLAGRQQAPAGVGQQPTFKTSTELVTLDVVVTDSHGQPVKSLSPDDFEVIENKRPVSVKQAIYVPLVGAAGASASAATLPANGDASSAAPKTVNRVMALVVDDLSLSLRSAVDVRSGLHKFIDTQIQPGDLVAILRTGAGMGTLQLFTTDKRLLHAAAERVRWNVVGRGSIEAFAPIEKSFSSSVPRGTSAASLDSTTPESHSTADTHVPDKHDSIEGLRDSILTGGSLGTLEVAVRSLQRLPGRKSVVFLSDGLDLSDMMGEPRIYGAVSRLMNSANRAGVVLYTIDTRGLMIISPHAEDPNPDRGAIEERHSSMISTQNGLRYLSEQTGAFAVINNNDINLGLQRIMTDQQGYYLLGYVATDKSVRSWDPDQLKVRVKRSGMTVRWRRGAFGPADAASPSEVPEDSLVTAALSPFNTGEMTLRVTAMFGHTPATGSYVHALFFVDINDVKFAHRVDDDVYTGEVELLVVAVNESGQRVKAWRKIEPMTLHAAEYEAARKRGITFDTAVSLKDAGGYQIRAAVRDTTTGNVGSSSQFVLVPKVGSGQLAISSVLMKGEQATESEAREQPAVRIFTPGTNVTYAYEIYTGLKNQEPLSTSSALLRDGQPIYSSPAQPIANADTGGSTGTGVKGLHVIPIGGTLTLGRDLQPGAYALQVNVTRDRVKPKDKARAVTRWVDFEIR